MNTINEGHLGTITQRQDSTFMEWIIPKRCGRKKTRHTTTKGKTYVVSDIHGMYNLFMKLLRTIRFSENDKLYILGDVVDRGEHPIKLLAYIMNQPNMELILGNHERLFLNYLDAQTYSEQQTALSYWLPNGGMSTYSEYQSRLLKEQKAIRQYLSTCPLYLRVEDFILVHSGIDKVKTDEELSVSEIMSRQDEDSLLWSREEFIDSEAISGQTIIFGHTQTPIIHKILRTTPPEKVSIWHDPIYQDKIGIDCGAVFGEKGGRLGCICLDDMTEFYVEGRSGI